MSWSKLKSIKRETLVKALAIIMIPGAIPIYLGFKVYQFSKEIYDERVKKQNHSEHKVRSEELPEGGDSSTFKR